MGDLACLEQLKREWKILPLLSLLSLPLFSPPSLSFPSLGGDSIARGYKMTEGPKRQQGQGQCWHGRAMVYI